MCNKTTFARKEGRFLGKKCVILQPETYGA